MGPYSRKGQRLKDIVFSSIIAIWSVMLFSCENDMAVVSEMSQPDTLPLVTSYEIQVYYSENGRPQFVLKAPVAAFYIGDDPRQEFTQGFHVTFFDTLLNKKAEFMADYGVNYEKRKLMEARSNVIVINHEKNERLNTEHLVWDQQKKKIFSNDFVKITTANDVLFGEQGFESDESLNNWVIRKPSGEFEIQEGAD